MYSRDLLVIDYETTGLSVRAGHEPVQLGAVRLDRDTLEERAAFESLIRPSAPDLADPEAMAVHGIPLERLAGAPEPRQVVDALEAAVLRPEERSRPWRVFHLAAHNASFDRAFHELLLERSGYRADRHGHRWLDTWTAALVLGDALRLELPSSASLRALCDHFGIARGPAHDALADARAAGAVLRALRGYAPGRRGLLARLFGRVRGPGARVP